MSHKHKSRVEPPPGSIQKNQPNESVEKHTQRTQMDRAQTDF